MISGLILENTALDISKSPDYMSRSKTLHRRYRATKIMLAIGLLIGSINLAWAEKSADEMIRDTVNEVVAELESRRAELEADRLALYELVDRIVVPRVALDRVSRLILGDYAKSASETQRQRFSESFKDLIMRSYASAMFEYTGEQEMRFGEVSVRGGGRISVVPSELVLAGQQSVEVDYYCLRDADAGWQIYDIQIDGISLIISYRNQYGEFIANNGLDALIESLEAKTAEVN